MYLDILFTLPNTHASPCEGYFVCSSSTKPVGRHSALATLRKIEKILAEGRFEWEHTGRSVGTYQPKGQDLSVRRQILRFVATKVYTGFESKFSLGAKVLDFMVSQSLGSGIRTQVYNSYRSIMAALEH